MKQNPAGNPCLFIPICRDDIFPALEKNSIRESSLVAIDKFPMYMVDVICNFSWYSSGLSLDFLSKYLDSSF